MDQGLYSVPLSEALPLPVQGLFSVLLSGTMPPPMLPTSWGQPTSFASWTGPALSLSATGAMGTSKDTTPRTRMMEGLLGPPFCIRRLEMTLIITLLVQQIFDRGFLLCTMIDDT